MEEIIVSPWCTLPNPQALEDLKYTTSKPLIGRSDPYEVPQESIPWESLEFKQRRNELEGQALRKHHGDKLPQELYDALDLLSCGMTKREVRQLVKSAIKKPSK